MQDIVFTVSSPTTVPVGRADLRAPSGHATMCDPVATKGLGNLILKVYHRVVMEFVWGEQIHDLTPGSLEVAA